MADERRGAVPLGLPATMGVGTGPQAGAQGSGEARTTANAAVAPETFDTYEVGTWWDVGRLSLTGALHRIAMHNVRETDPSSSKRTIPAGDWMQSLKRDKDERHRLFGLHGQVRFLAVGTPDDARVTALTDNCRKLVPRRADP